MLVFFCILDIFLIYTTYIYNIYIYRDRDRQSSKFPGEKPQGMRFGTLRPLSSFGDVCSLEQVNFTVTTAAAPPEVVIVLEAPNRKKKGNRPGRIF